MFKPRRSESGKHLVEAMCVNYYATLRHIERLGGGVKYDYERNDHIEMERDAKATGRNMSDAEPSADPMRPQKWSRGSKDRVPHRVTLGAIEGMGEKHNQKSYRWQTL